MLPTLGEYINLWSLLLIAAALLLAPATALYEGDPCSMKSINGVCTAGSKCNTLQQFVKSGQLKPSEIMNCGFDLHEEIICCPTLGRHGEVPTLAPTKEPVLIVEETTKSDKEHLPTTTTASVGKSNLTADQIESLIKNVFNTDQNATTTTTPSTTSPKPLKIGDRELDPNAEFFDLSKLLNLKNKQNQNQNAALIQPKPNVNEDVGVRQPAQPGSGPKVGHSLHNTPNQPPVQVNQGHPLKGSINQNSLTTPPHQGNAFGNKGLHNQVQNTINNNHPAPQPNRIQQPQNWDNQFEERPIRVQHLNRPLTNQNLHHNQQQHQNNQRDRPNDLRNDNHGRSIPNHPPNNQNQPFNNQHHPNIQHHPVNTQNPVRNPQHQRNAQIQFGNVWDQNQNQNHPRPNNGLAQQQAWLSQNQRHENINRHVPTQSEHFYNPNNLHNQHPQINRPVNNQGHHFPTNQQIQFPNNQRPGRPAHGINNGNSFGHESGTGFGNNFPNAEWSMHVPHPQGNNQLGNQVVWNNAFENNRLPAILNQGQEQFVEWVPSRDTTLENPTSGNIWPTEHNNQQLNIQPVTPTTTTATTATDPFAAFQFRPSPDFENNGIEVAGTSDTANELHTDFSPKPTTPSTPTTTVISRVDERPALKACRELDEGLLPSLTPHILDGTPVDWGEYPHMAAIGYRRIGNERGPYDFLCGGSLIDPKFVLTAAHCVNSKESQPSIVRLGVANFSDSEQMAVRVEIDIKQVHIHPQYSGSSKYNDIALLELVSGAQNSDYIYPVCLQTDLLDPALDAKLFVTGWGTINTATKQTSNQLLKARLNITSVSNCNMTYEQLDLHTRQLARGVINTQLCAFDPEAKKDACQGDSGGPLNMVLDESLRKYRIVGIISAGAACGTSAPGLYTRVAAYIDYIESIVWPAGR